MRALRGVVLAGGLAAAVTAAVAQQSAPAKPKGVPPLLGATERAAARVHAQDIADVFREACLGHAAAPDEVADWALMNGFVPDTPAARDVAGALKQRGEVGNVFARPKGGVLLIATDKPANCVVMGLDAVDGPRLRGRMESLSGEFPGGKPVAEPSRSLDYDEDGPHRSLSYLGQAGAERFRVTVVSPVGVARGTAIMGMAFEPPSR